MAEVSVFRVVHPITLEKQLSKFPAELLDRPCAESILGKLVHMIDTESMMLLATDLELLAAEVDDIQTAWPRKPAVQRLEMFKKWKQKNKSQATYRWVHVQFQSLGCFLSSIIKGCYCSHPVVHVYTMMMVYQSMYISPVNVQMM